MIVCENSSNAPKKSHMQNCKLPAEFWVGAAYPHGMYWPCGPKTKVLDLLCLHRHSSSQTMMVTDEPHGALQMPGHLAQLTRARQQQATNSSQDATQRWPQAEPRHEKTQGMPGLVMASRHWRHGWPTAHPACHAAVGASGSSAWISSRTEASNSAARRSTASRSMSLFVCTSRRA